MGKLFGKHPEGEYISQNALVRVGTFHKDGLGNGGWNDTDGGPRFFLQLFVGLASFLLFAILLFLASLQFVVRLEGIVHEELLDVGCKGFTHGLGAFDDDMEEEGTRSFAIVMVLETHSGSEGTEGR